MARLKLRSCKNEIVTTTRLVECKKIYYIFGEIIWFLNLIQIPILQIVLKHVLYFESNLLHTSIKYYDLNRQILFLWSFWYIIHIFLINNTLDMNFLRFYYFSEISKYCLVLFVPRLVLAKPHWEVGHCHDISHAGSWPGQHCWPVQELTAGEVVHNNGDIQGTKGLRD
jgi:hypothetical protein